MLWTDLALSKRIRAMNRQYSSISLRVIQPIVLVFGLSTLIIYLLSIPAYYNILITECVLHGCSNVNPAPPTTEALLSAIGLTTSSYAILFVIIDCTFTLLFAASAVVMGIKGRKEPMALLASTMLGAFGTTFPQLIHAATLGHPFWSLWFSGIGAVGWVTLFLFICLFPDGRFTHKWIIVPIACFAAVKLVGLLFPESILDHNQWSLITNIFLFLAPITVLIYSQSYRYRTSSPPEQRQQTKWVTYGFTVGLVAFIIISLLFYPGLFHSPLAYVYLNGFLHLFLLIIPLTLTFAILKKRLWDVDPIVNRTLVYVSLTACIVALYSFSIIFFGKMLLTDDRFLPSLISTVVVALLFAPLKERLQRNVDRFLKGRHDDPYGMLSELHNLLIKPLPPESMLDSIVKFIRKALRIPYVAIVIEVNGLERLASSDSEGSMVTGNHTFPIIHRGKEVGALIVANRPHEPFTAEDRRLLDVLLGHVGPIVDNFIMTKGMKLLVDDLQLSREKLIVAREEERRMIRRNLHDELAPRLAALGLNVSAAEMHVKRNSNVALALLAELRQVIRTTVEDIRTLVHDMRPASLDEWGLIGAIQERIRELTKPIQIDNQSDGAPIGLQFEFEAPQLPPLPAAVEVAAYRIISEAIANVVRHAHATVCTIKLSMNVDEQLTIEVTDNGIGMDERWYPLARGGIGIGSMRERATELGGVCTIDRHMPTGTKVLARLPIIVEEGALN